MNHCTTARWWFWVENLEEILVCTGEPLLDGTLCPEPESNQRHEDFQSSALPTELSGLIAFATKVILHEEMKGVKFFVKTKNLNKMENLNFPK